MKNLRKSIILLALFLACFSLLGFSQFNLTPFNNSPGAITVSGSATTGIYIGNRGGVNTVVGVDGLFSLSAGGTSNSAFGNKALYYVTSGQQNSGFGDYALWGASTGATGQMNAAFGANSVKSLTTGQYNSGFGAWSGRLISSGDGNTAIGQLSMTNLTTGSNNVAVGVAALTNNVSGSNNVAIGWSSLRNGSGSDNVGIGTNSEIPTPGLNEQLSIMNVLYGINMNASSNGNLSIGLVPALILGGSQNGKYARLKIGGTAAIPSLQLTTVPTSTNVTNNYLYVDAGGVVSQGTLAGTTGYNSCSTPGVIPMTNNVNGNMGCSQIYDAGTGSGVGIGTTTGFTYTGTTITGQIGPAPTVGSVFKLVVNGTASGTAFIALSDKRLKKDIKKIDNPIEKISKINGYTYNWNKDYKTNRELDNTKQAGFLAQEILEVLPEAVVKASDGIYGLNYNAIMPLLAEGIKAQQKHIESQDLKISELETTIQDLSQRMNRIVPSEIAVNDEYFTISPNPITQTSLVSYKLLNTTGGNYFAVYDLQGKLLKKYNVNSSNKEGQIKINKAEFGNGMYILSLISNNSEIQSKRFIISQ